MCSVPLLPEQCLPQAVGEGAVAPHAAPVLQRQKPCQGGSVTCSCQCFSTIVLVWSCIGVLRHPSYKLNPSVSPCDQGLFSEVVPWHLLAPRECSNRTARPSACISTLGQCRIERGANSKWDCCQWDRRLSPCCTFP